MAVNQPDYTPAGMIQSGTNQYRPLDTSAQDQRNADYRRIFAQRDSDYRRNKFQAERDMRLNQYDIDREKRAEQLAIRNELSNLNSAGLPKEMQGEINYDLEQYNKQLESGELQVGTPEEAMARNRIKSKIANFEGLVKDANAFALSDTQVMTQDELGYLDKKPEVVGEVFSWQQNDFDPNNPISNRIGQYQETFYSATPRQQLDPEALDKQAENFIDRNAQYRTEVEELRKQGYNGVDLIQQIQYIDPTAKKAFEDYLMQNNYTALGSMYADRRRYAEKAGMEVPEMNAYMQGALSPWNIQTPRYTDEQSVKYDRAKELGKDARAAAKADKPYTLTTTTITEGEGGNLVRGLNKKIDELVTGEGQLLDSEGNEMTKENAKKKVTKEVQDIIEKGNITSYKINPPKKGKQLPPLTVGGKKGIVESVYMDDNGEGYILMNEEYTQYVKRDGDNIGRKIYVPVAIPLTDENKQEIENTYGVSLAPQKETKTETPQERAARIAAGG